MSNFFRKALQKISETIYKNISVDSGLMILITSIIGIMLSTVAQSLAAATNKKYTKEQKMFMIPQELSEGAVTVLSLLLVTTPLKTLAKKYVASGKLLNADMIKYCKDNNLIEQRGKINFKDKLKDTVSKIEASDEFVKASDSLKEKMLKPHTDMQINLQSLDDSVSAIVTTAGGVLSTAFVTPFARNAVASSYQKKQLNSQNNLNNKTYPVKYSSDPLKI